MGELEAAVWTVPHSQRVGEKEDKQKIAILLTAMGTEAMARFNQFSWDNEEDKKK